MFFFFQAEDGIRDTSVTGVQTCALPISWSAGGQVVTSDVQRRDQVEPALFVGRGKVAEIRDRREELRYDLVIRSEERRVGKEGRGLGSTVEENEIGEQDNALG